MSRQGIFRPLNSIERQFVAKLLGRATGKPARYPGTRFLIPRRKEARREKKGLDNYLGKKKSPPPQHTFWFLATTLYCVITLHIMMHNLCTGSEIGILGFRIKGN
jgi:hypothetical protein